MNRKFKIIIYDFMVTFDQFNVFLFNFIRKTLIFLKGGASTQCNMTVNYYAVSLFFRVKAIIF